MPNLQHINEFLANTPNENALTALIQSLPTTPQEKQEVQIVVKKLKEQQQANTISLSELIVLGTYYLHADPNVEISEFIDKAKDCIEEQSDKNFLLKFSDIVCLK